MSYEICTPNFDNVPTFEDYPGIICSPNFDNLESVSSSSIVSSWISFKIVSSHFRKLKLKIYT